MNDEEVRVDEYVVVGDGLLGKVGGATFGLQHSVKYSLLWGQNGSKHSTKIGQ